LGQLSNEREIEILNREFIPELYSLRGGPMLGQLRLCLSNLAGRAIIRQKKVGQQFYPCEYCRASSRLSSLPVGPFGISAIKRIDFGHL
jgi:hypothetical protein